MNDIPCTSKISASCEDCNLNGSLMCRYDSRDTTHFFMIILPFFVTTIGGMVAGGYGWWLFGWLAYMIFFFFVWEAHVLCSHCPYWANEGRILRCHANYGVFKLWRYHPEPMGRSEQVQFLIGALLVILYPLVFLLIGGEYLLAGIGFASAISLVYLLHRNICNRCVNFSCPLNHVNSETQQAFFNRNPIIAKAWKSSSRSIK
jgi:hypothetical protein